MRRPSIDRGGVASGAPDALAKPASVRLPAMTIPRMEAESASGAAFTEGGTTLPFGMMFFGLFGVEHLRMRAR